MAEPRTRGITLRDGEEGRVLSRLGGGGESSTKDSAAEHGDSLPAASRALAVNVVVVSSVTLTAMPGLASDSAVPVATAVPPQAAAA